MRPNAPFQADDLEALHVQLLSQADRVVPMRDVFMGDTSSGTIGLRHDVDDNPGSFTTALLMAQWEFEHGYSSTYYLLHGAYYWGWEMFDQVSQFEELGHEVGLHVNGIAEALRHKRPPHYIVADALSDLRATGVRVDGCVAHGDPLCHRAQFVNDEMFTESPRPKWGAPNRLIEWDGVVCPLEPMSRSHFGLDYDANWLGRKHYLSDSGGEWSQRFEGVCERFGDGQLHVLIHPDWWGEAFAPVEVAA